MSDKEYLIFIPPPVLSNRTPKEWSNAEAKVYFEWLMQNIEKRVNGLLSYLDETLSGSPEDVLERIGNTVANILHTSEFSKHIGDKPTLNNKGYALAADMGLLLAKIILNEISTVTWKIIMKPKNDVDYHKPVLVIGNETFEPIGVSIGDSICILNGMKKYDVWKKIYIYTKSAVNGSLVGSGLRDK